MRWVSIDHRVIEYRDLTCQCSRNGQGQGTQLLRLDRPLDFAAVTDHSEFLGEVDICLSPDMPGYDDPLCETYRENGPLGRTLLGITLISEMPERNAGICGDGKRCLDAALPVWNEIIASAERFNDAGLTDEEASIRIPITLAN